MKCLSIYYVALIKYYTCFHIYEHIFHTEIENNIINYDIHINLYVN